MPCVSLCSRVMNWSSFCLYVTYCTDYCTVFTFRVLYVNSNSWAKYLAVVREYSVALAASKIKHVRCSRHANLGCPPRESFFDFVNTNSLQFADGNSLGLAQPSQPLLPVYRESAPLSSRSTALRSPFLTNLGPLPTRRSLWHLRDVLPEHARLLQPAHLI